MENKYANVNSLCWSCAKACGYCSWSCALEPVKGWETRETHSGPYCVVSCPEYLDDSHRLEVMKTKPMLSMPEAVSYTHLDVYKRQAKGNGPHTGALE